MNVLGGSPALHTLQTYRANTEGLPTRPCQSEICRVPGDSSPLDEKRRKQLVFNTHTSHTHITHPFQLLSHYPFSQHMMDTLQLEYLGLKLFSEGSRALVLAMYYWCRLSAFLQLVVILWEHNSNCSFGMDLDGIYYTRTPRFNSQSPVRKKFVLFFWGVKIACLPLFTTNLSSPVLTLNSSLSAALRLLPSIPNQA